MFNPASSSGLCCHKSLSTGDRQKRSSGAPKRAGELPKRDQRGKKRRREERLRFRDPW